MSQFSGSTFGSYSRVYLIVLGAIFLVTGIGVAIALGNVPYAGGGMLLMGGIFAVVGGGLIVIGVIVGRGASNTKTLLQTGIAGTATITGLTQTGVFFNDNPQIQMNLLVQLPGEVPYAASHREVVPLMLLGRLSSGQPLAVRVDQMDRSKIAIDWSNTGAVAPSPAATMAGYQQMAAAQAAAAQAPGMAMPGAYGTPTTYPPGFGAPMPVAAQPNDESLAQVQASLAGTAGMQVAQPFSTPDQASYTVEQLRAWLRQNGLEAKAHVDQLEDTGKIVGDEHEFKVQVTLNIPGQAPQQLPASVAMVPQTVAHKLFQGMDVPVRYAAQNHSLLMVEWDKV